MLLTLLAGTHNYRMAMCPLQFVDAHRFASTPSRSVRKLTWICFALHALCLPLATKLWAQPFAFLEREYIVSTVSTRQGLAQNKVNAIAQTPDGYIWFGTLYGFCRYDGSRILTFDKTNCSVLAESDTCEAMAVTNDGSLWIGTFGGLIQVSPTGDFRKWTMADGLPKNRVSALAKDVQGGLWVRTGGILSHWSEGTIVQQGQPPDLTGENYEIQAIGSLPEGGCAGVFRIQAATGVQYGLLEFDQAREDPIQRTVDDFPSDHINRLIATSDGTIYVGGRQGLHLIRGQRSQHISRIQQPIEDQINFVTDLWQLDDERIWYTQSNRLLLSSNGSSSVVETLPPHLAAFSVNAHIRDREGNHWLGTDRDGVVKLRPRTFQNIGEVQGLRHDNVYSVCEGANESVLIGTRDGFYRVGTDRNIRLFNESTIGMRLRSASTILSDPYGQIWVGSGDGLEVIAKDKPYQFGGTVGFQQLGPEYEKNGVASLHLTQDQEIWIGAVHGVFRVDAKTNPIKLGNGTTVPAGEFHLPNLEQIPLRTKSDQPLEPEARTFLKTAEGAMWIGTKNNGVFYLRDEAPRQLTQQDGLPANHGWALYEDQENRVWVGTEEGLAFWDGSRFQTITTTDGLAENVINAIQADDTGQVWIAGLKGIYRIAQNQLSLAARNSPVALFPIQYNELDGMASSETNGGRQTVSCRLSDGRLCFATVRGLSIVDPPAALRNDLAPHSVVEEVRANGKTVYQFHSPSGRSLLTQDKGYWQFPPGSGEFIEFIFTANTFIGSQRVKFAYQLRGHDADEIKTNGRRHASYTNLSPGKYEFQLRASNSHGVWSAHQAEQTFKFQILPHFYETKAFYGILIIGSLMAVIIGHFGLVRFRVGQERLRGEVAQMKSRIKLSRDLHDDLGAGLTRISLLTENAKSAPHSEETQIDIDKIAKQARELSSSLSDIVWMTNPQNQQLPDLISYLRRMIGELLEEANIEFSASIAENIPLRTLTQGQRQNIYLIVKEILNNILKHSGATLVTFTVEYHKEVLMIGVTDNGIGIATNDRPPGHNGLNNIEARAQEIKATAQISEQLPHGICIQLSIPL